MNDPVAPLDALLAAPPTLWTDLAAALRAAEYDDRVLDRAEAIVPGQVDHLRLPLVQWWLEQQPDAAAALALLFSYGGALPAPRARELLGEPLVEGLARAGVLARSAGGIRSVMRLLPFEGIWALSDHLSQEGDPAMGPGRTTLRLARWMGDTKGRRVLDLGCGAGSLALVAAKRGAEATAVDISERAVALTKINARLNDLEVDARAGDLFAPVEGETFDLIVAQPPFVIRADDMSQLTFLHGGGDGDELTMRVFAELAGSMAPAGRALVLFQAPVRPERSVVERVSALTAPERLSLVLSVLGYLEPDGVAVVTAAETHSSFGAEYARAARGYRSALSRRKIDRVVEALADLRRDEARPFSVAVHWTTEGSLHAEHLEQAFGTGRALAAGSLLDLPIRLRDGARVESSQALTGDTAPTLRLRIPGVPVPEQNVDSDALSLISAIDELGTLRAALSEVAAPEDIPELVPRVSRIVQNLLLNGTLILRD